MVGQKPQKSPRPKLHGRARRGASPFPLPRGRKEVGSRHELRHVGQGHGCVPLGRRSSAAVAADFILKMMSAGRFGSRGERSRTVETPKNRMRAPNVSLVGHARSVHHRSHPVLGQPHGVVEAPTARLCASLHICTHPASLRIARCMPALKPAYARVERAITLNN